VPWTKDDYPDSLKNFTEPVREKAIEIANSLLEKQGYSESKAIAIATTQAKQWAARRDIEISTVEGDDGPTPAKAPEIHVVPADEGWRIRTGDGEDDAAIYEKQSEAISQARVKAHEANTDIIIHRADGKIRERISLRRLDDGPTYHVSARDDDWIVIEEGAARVLDDKAEAVAVGREIARHQHGALVIHRSDGSVQESHDYSERPERR
jgi:uncharacterized protein YdaT